MFDVSLNSLAFSSVISNSQESLDAIERQVNTVLNKTRNPNENTGRPEKSDSEKSEKTIANRESMS